MKAGTAGGIEAVVKAINAHINNVDVCYAGCRVLWNMTLDDGKAKSQDKNQSKTNR